MKSAQRTPKGSSSSPSRTRAAGSRTGKATQPKASQPKASPSTASRSQAAAPKSALALSSRPPGLSWRTPLLFAVVAPLLFMLIDMSFEQALSESGFSLKDLWIWIAEDGFAILRAVYLIGVLPAAFAGLLIARRDQRGGATSLFALGLSFLFALPVAIVFARNLFLFAPPPMAEQVLIGLRVVVGVVISGMVCYALSRWLARRGR